MENQRVSRVAQIIGVIIGLLGLYPAYLGLINLYSAIAYEFMVVFLAIPMLAITVILEVFAYRAIFKQTIKTFESISAIIAFLLIVYADDYIETLIAKIDIIINPIVTSDGITIVMAIVTYYGLRMIMTIESKAVKPNKAL